jgi:hypothetical protein
MLLIGAAAISVPAFAQEQPATDPTAPPPTEQPAPTPPADDMTTPPAGDMAAQPAPSGTAATPGQVARIVDQEFPTYDSDANGELNEAEFAAWMKKLRAATDPSVDTESEAVKTWIGQAYAAADADKSGGVNKAELTSFLTRGA